MDPTVNLGVIMKREVSEPVEDQITEVASDSPDSESICNSSNFCNLNSVGFCVEIFLPNNVPSCRNLLVSYFIAPSSSFILLLIC
jgi:hypothetical protein